VLILDGQDHEIGRLISGRSDDRRWIPYHFDLTAYAGQTIKLYFGVYNDGWDGVTAMYVDDVSLKLCAPTTLVWLNRR
jgi:bacillopeptidase F (M6 metalloprotease family)